MAAVEPLSKIIGIEINQLPIKEVIILEAILFNRVCDSLKDIIHSEYKNYFFLMKYDRETEDAMLDANFLCFIVNDILNTGDYSISGIANYTQFPEDVIYDVASGSNTTPSLPLTRKIINLHIHVRPTLYVTILKKFANEVLSAEG